MAAALPVLAHWARLYRLPRRCPAHPRREDRASIARLEPLRAYRIPYAQFDQPKGFFNTLPSNETSLPNTYFAGEFTAASSINGAIRSGEKAAQLVLVA